MTNTLRRLYDTEDNVPLDVQVFIEALREDNKARNPKIDDTLPLLQRHAGVVDFVQNLGAFFKTNKKFTKGT